MPELGLIGKDISYSFSQKYFTRKFEKMDLRYTYKNFDIPNVEIFKEIINDNPNIIGLNVTIPYKEEIIPHLDELDKRARKIGAVNTVKISREGKLIGYNTDHYGFLKSLKPHLKDHHNTALILGTGGASKAVAYALKKLKIKVDYVSRKETAKAKFLYSDLSDHIISSYAIIVNTTPVGTFPNVNDCPNIPFDSIGEKHILYDLVYNPPMSKFLICGEVQGATVINGQRMLELQAEKAWELWNQK